jgi:hypothetical protein
MSVAVSVCVPVCLCACVPVCLCACVCVCLSVCLSLGAQVRISDFGLSKVLEDQPFEAGSTLGEIEVCGCVGARAHASAHASVFGRVGVWACGCVGVVLHAACSNLWASCAHSHMGVRCYACVLVSLTHSLTHTHVHTPVDVAGSRYLLVFTARVLPAGSVPPKNLLQGGYSMSAKSVSRLQ